MTASGVNHHGEEALVVLLELNEMIAAAQRSNLKVSGIQLAEKFAVLLIFVHLVQCPVQDVGGHGLLVVGKAYRDIAHNVSDDGLNQVSASCHDLPEIICPDAGLDVGHAAANVHAHRIGNDHILRGDHSADGHSHACVRIGHKADRARKKWKVGQMKSLLPAGGLQLFFSFQPHLYGDFHGFSIIQYEHIDSLPFIYRCIYHGIRSVCVLP